MNKMIINIRGPNGSGKTKLVQDLLDSHNFYEVINGNYIPEYNLFIIGPYIKNGEFMSTGGCDQLSVNEVIHIIKSCPYSNILFESAAVSRSYKIWAELATEIGFYDYKFIHLNTPMDICIKSKAERKIKWDRSGENKTKHLIDGFKSCENTQKKLFEGGFQLYRTDRKTARKLVYQFFEKDFVKLALYLSGGGKRSGTRSYGLYCYINRPEFQHLEWIRNSVHRLDQFNFDFKDKTVLEFGSNIGALSFEIELRGARWLKGYEYNPERVAFCNMYSYKHNLPCKFFQIDFNQELPNVIADVTVCCAVDEYIYDVPLFYNFLRKSTKEICLLECNVQRGQTVEDTIDMLSEAGFNSVKFLGMGDSGKIAKKRKLYRCTA